MIPLATRFSGAVRYLPNGSRISHNFVCNKIVVRASNQNQSPNSSKDDDHDINSEQPADSRGRGFGRPASSKDDPRQLSTADALRQSLGDLSEAQGRKPRGTNIVFGTDESEEKWRELDSQVNEYPGQRSFKAIGAGGDDFVIAMTACVESVVGKVHEECVSSRWSAKGNYVSVTVGPVWVENPDQVLAIYNAMKEDGRLKFYI